MKDGIDRLPSFEEMDKKYPGGRKIWKFTRTDLISIGPVPKGRDNDKENQENVGGPKAPKSTRK